MLDPVALADMGWHLVPWSNRASSNRQPMVKDYLKIENKPKSSTIQVWQAKWLACDWAIVPHDHMVLDVEMKGGLDGEKELAALQAEHGELPEGPVTRSYSGGLHLWFRLPTNCTLTGGVRLTKGIEIKCRTGCIHIPPSAGYVPIRELEHPDDVPVAPTWLIKLWSEAKPMSVRTMEKEVYGEGERHAALCSHAGKFRNMGLGEHAIFFALQGVRLEKCENPDTISDSELQAIAKSFAKKEADSFELRLEQKEQEALSVEAFFKRAVTVAEERTAPVEAGLPVLNAALLRPTNMIAQWVDWVLGNADRKQPELTLLAACVGIGGLIGRRLTWHHSHANLYGLGLASSGSGKDAPLHSISKVYTAAGFADLMGASRLGSDAGMLSAITNKPNIVWALDEISLLLENTSKPGCPGYLIGLIQYMLEFYSCNPHQGIELKGIPPVPIPNPFPCIMGFTQPAVFATVFSEKMANNGLMGRFVPFLGEDLPAKNFNALRDPPPPALIQALKSARTAKPAIFDAVGSSKLAVEIECDEATEAHYVQRSREIEARMQAVKTTDRMGATLLARTMEKAQKFSLIHAWSLDPITPVMTIASIDWGIAVVEYSNACMQRITTTRAQNPQEEMVEYLYDCVCKQGMKGISQQKLSGIAKRLDRLRRESILKDLTDSGRIYHSKVKSSKGPATTVFIADKFVTPTEQSI